jgi:hypothetical protein
MQATMRVGYDIKELYNLHQDLHFRSTAPPLDLDNLN